MMKIFIGICFFILLSLVGCGDKKGKEVSEVPVIRLDPDHVDTLKVSDYFSHIDGFVLTVCSSPTIVFCMSWTIRNIFVIP